MFKNDIKVTGENQTVCILMKRVRNASSNLNSDNYLHVGIKWKNTEYVITLLNCAHIQSLMVLGEGDKAVKY